MNTSYSLQVPRYIDHWRLFARSVK